MLVVIVNRATTNGENREQNAVHLNETDYLTRKEILKYSTTHVNCCKITGTYTAHTRLTIDTWVQQMDIQSVKLELKRSVQYWILVGLTESQNVLR